MIKHTEIFENRGIERQYGATNAKRAKSAFKTSCTIYSTRGIQLNCDQCGIAVAHDSVMLLFEGATKAIS